METLICFSHLRWDFVWQRPQHLMSRFAREKQVIFWEEPKFDLNFKTPVLSIKTVANNIKIITPHINQETELRELLLNYINSIEPSSIVKWYYTPMMYSFSRDLPALCTVYDCMDELSLFKNPPEGLIELEKILLKEADLVFTGGHSLYLEKQKERHRHIFPFPSSVDKQHFSKAILNSNKMKDQENLSYPRVGYIGVIDERLDLELIRETAKARPNYNFIFVGPIAKIEEDELPKLPNIRYLGPKKYEELPDYISGWNVCWMPFALNNATKFISPTKTPEYLATGRAVVSTPVPDVVYGYSGLDCVFIGDKEEIPQLLDQAMHSICADSDRKVASMSWDKTYERMSALVQKVEQGRKF